MFTLKLPYAIGAIAYVPYRNHMGVWHYDKYKIVRYSYDGKVLEVSLSLLDNHGFKLSHPDNLFPTEAAVLEFIEKKKAEAAV